MLHALNDADAFYRRIDVLSRSEMLMEIHKELRLAPEPRYSEFLKGLHFFLTEWRIPSNYHHWQIDRLKVFASELVERGIADATILEQFPT